MNNNNDNKRIRDSEENRSRPVTLISRASEESHIKLVNLLANEGYQEANIKLVEINSNLIDNLKKDGEIKDADELRKISGLESKLLILYADEDIGLEASEVTVLSQALEKLHQDHTNILAIGHLFLGGETNGLLLPMTKDNNEVGTVKSKEGQPIYATQPKEKLHFLHPGWLKDDDEEISFTKMDGDKAVTYNNILPENQLFLIDGTYIRDEHVPLYSNPAREIGGDAITLVYTSSIPSTPIVVSNALNDTKPTLVCVNMDLDQPDDLHYIIGKAMSYTGSLDGCTDPSAIQYNIAATIYEDPCVQLRSEITSEKAILNNEDSDIKLKLSLNNDKINNNVIDLQGERQISLEINGTERIFSAHDDTNHEDHGSDTKGKLGDFEYELAEGKIEIILEDGEFDEDIETHKAPITNTNDERYTDDSNHPDYEKYNNGWEEFEYNLIIHEISTEETDSTHPHYGTHDKYYVNVPLKLTDSLGALTTELKIEGQIRKIYKDGSHELTNSVSLNNALELYGAKTINLGTHVHHENDGDAGDHVFDALTSFDVVDSEKLKAITMEGEDLTFTYEVTIPEGTIDELGDELMIELEVEDASGAELNLDSGKDHKEFELKLALAECTDEDATNYNSNADKDQLMDDGTLADTLCIYSGCHNTNADNYAENSFINANGVVTDKSNKGHLIQILDDLCHIDVCEDTNASNYDEDAAGEFIRNDVPGLCQYRKNIELSIERNNIFANVIDGEGNIEKDYKNLKDENDVYVNYLNLDQGVKVTVKSDELATEDKVTLKLNGQKVHVLKEADELKSSLDYSIIIELSEGTNIVLLEIENEDDSIATQTETISIMAKHLRCPQDRDLPSSTYSLFAYNEDVSVIEDVNSALDNNKVSLSHYPEFYDVLKAHAESDEGKAGEVICQINGCMDTNFEDYDETLNATRHDDALCITKTVYGCTVKEAKNFDEDAHVDNGTCEVKGCVDINASRACNYIDQNDSKFDGKVIDWQHDQNMCLFIDAKPEKLQSKNEKYILDLGDEDKQQNPEFNVVFTEIYEGQEIITNKASAINPLDLGLSETELDGTKWQLETPRGDNIIIELKKVSGRFRSVSILGHITESESESITSWSFHKEPQYFQYSDKFGIKFATPYNLEFTTNDIRIRYVAYLKSEHEVGFGENAVDIDRMARLNLTDAGSNEMMSFERYYDIKKDAEGNPILDEDGNQIKLDKDDQPLPKDYLDTAKCDINRISIRNLDGSAAPSNILYVEQNGEKLFTNYMVKLGGYYFNPDALSYGDNEFKLKLHNLAANYFDFVGGSEFIVHKVYTACTDQTATNYDSTAEATADDSLCEYDLCGVEGDGTWLSHAYDSNCGDGKNCVSINACKLEVCTDEGADEYVTFDESLHIKNNSLCRYTRCTDPAATNYNLLASEPSGLSMVNDYDPETATESQKAIVEAAQIKLFNIYSFNFSGAVIITSEDETSVTKLSSNTNLIFNDVRTNGFPDGEPQQSDFRKADGSDDEESYNIKLEEYNDKKANEEEATSGNGFTVVDINNIHIRLDGYGKWKVQYILNNPNSRINEIKPANQLNFDHTKPQDHERGVLEITVEVGPDGYVLHGDLVEDDQNLCTGVDPCDGEDKLYKDFIELDACEVCILDEDQHILAIDENGMCDDTNGNLHGGCPEGLEADECGVCRDARVTNDEGEIEYPEDWNQSCNDCSGEPTDADGNRLIDGLPAHVVNACGDCVSPSTPLDLHDETNYCDDSNLESFGECPQGHLDDCEVCHATAPTTTGGVTTYPSGWNDKCGVCNDTAAHNYQELKDEETGEIKVAWNENKCEFYTCNDSNAMNEGLTNSVKDKSFVVPYGSNLTPISSACVYEGCSNQLADNYNNGTDHELNTTRASACEYDYCGDENACNYMTEENKKEQVGSEEGTFNTKSSICKTAIDFDISLTSIMKENNVDYEVTLPEADAIGHQKLKLEIEGNLLQSLRQNIGEIKSTVANPSGEPLTIFPVADKFGDNFNGLIKSGNRIDCEINFTDDELMIPISVNDDDEAVSYKSSALISAEEAKELAQAEFDKKNAAYETAVAAKASKETDITTAEAALGDDQDVATAETLWGDYNAAQETVTNAGANVTTQQEDARDAALAAKDAAVDELVILNDQLAVLTAALTTATGEKTTAQGDLTQAQTAVENAENQVNQSIVNGRVPVPVTMTWHRDQEDELLVAVEGESTYLRTYNLEIEFDDESDKDYFGATHLLIHLQDNNYVTHLGEIRNGDNKVAHASMNGFTPKNARLANSMSFGECKVDDIKLEFKSGSLEKKLTLLKNSAYEFDVENDTFFKQLSIGDKIEITATARTWIGYDPKDILVTTREVTLHKLGCTDTDYGSYHESNTMPFTYTVKDSSDNTETVSSCRNSGCLDEFADTYDPTADHADLSLCEYSVTNNVDDEDECNYDSNATLLSDSSVSEYAKYKFYCEDESSDLCQLWLESGMDMLPAQDKKITGVNMTVNSEGVLKNYLNKNDEIVSGPFTDAEGSNPMPDELYLLFYAQVTNEYLALLNEPEYDLEETADLLALEEKYRQYIFANRKDTKLSGIIYNSVNKDGNDVAEIIDHKATVGRALASMQEAAEAEDDAAKIVYDNLKTAFLAKYTDDELETYDTNITEQSVQTYLDAKLARHINKRIEELSCSGGVPYLVLTARTEGNIEGADMVLSDIGNVNNDKIELKPENAHSVEGNVLAFKIGPTNNYPGKYAATIMTPAEYQKERSALGLERSTAVNRSMIVNESEIDVGIAECNDTNANNYDEDELAKEGRYGTKSVCEYHWCNIDGAHNYNDKENLPSDGSEGKNVENDDVCEFYYCDAEEACNYYAGDKTLLYNNSTGLALTATSAQQAIAVGTAASNICFIPTIEMTSKFETSKFYKAENTANVLRGKTELIKGHFNSNLLSTQLDQSVFEDKDFEIVYDNDNGKKYTMYLGAIAGQSYAGISAPAPGGPIDKDVYGSWSFSRKAQQIDLGDDLEFGYNIVFTEQHPNPAQRARLFLRVTNNKDHLFKGILSIPGQDPKGLTGNFASEDPLSRKRVSKIFDHKACDEVISLALMSNGTEVDRIYGDSEEFVIKPLFRDSDEPVPFKIVGLDSNGAPIHESDEFEILFLRTECGDSNAVNYYDGINNDPKNTECEYLNCLDTNNCNYDDEAAPNGGEWIHDESLCWVTNNDDECCPELNECGACGELQTDVDTGMCVHGDRNGECPEGMIEDRCGNCFASETDEGFDECVGCTTEDDYYYDSNATEHDESMCAVCGNVEACNYDSNAKADLSNVHNELCEYNTISNIEVLPSLDNHMESKEYTKYDDFEVVFDSNIFLNPFTNEHVAGEWTIGDMKLELSEGERKFTVSGVEYHDGDLVDGQEIVGSWRLYSTEQTLTAKQVSGAEWTRLESNTDQITYNLVIQTSDNTIYYINMGPFYSNPISAWNVISDGQEGQLEHKFMRKDAKAEDNGDSCYTVGVDYKLLRKATQKEIDENELKEEWIESASGTVTENRLQITSDAPGLHMLKLKPSCDTCDGNKWEEHEFTLMSEDCKYEEAENYAENLFKTLGVSEEYVVESMQNKLVQSGNQDAEGNNYMVPQSTGACQYMGCNANALACNYSENFELSGPCFMPEYGKTCAGGCVVKLDENGQPLLDENGNEQPNKDQCGDCHPLDVEEDDPRWNERCADCAGVPYGQHDIDLCGNCVLKGTEEFNAACTDCAGIIVGQEGYGHYLVYTDAKDGLCTKTHKVCGDTNACNYDDAEDVNPLAIDNSVCTYPQGYLEGRQTADCDGNCLEGYTADCRGLCGLETDETFLVKDSCGWCGGSSQNCSPLNLQEGHRWQVASSCDKNSSIYDPHRLILSMYKINNDSDKERYQLLWESKSEDDESISKEELEPKTMLWIEIKDGSTQDELDEIHFMNLTAIQQLAKDARVRLGHLGVRKAEVPHVLSKATNILDGSSIRGYADELAVELVADEEKQTVLAEIQINKRETNANGLVINNGEIDHFWMHIDGTCTVRLFHADMNNAGTVVQLVGPNGLTPIESRDEAVEIIVGDNETDQDVWVKVQIQNRIDDGSNFTDLITDSNDEKFDEERLIRESEATKTSYETVIVAIERPGTKFTGADSKVNITYSLDGPEGIDA